jgi:hypothetical protein
MRNCLSSVVFVGLASFVSACATLAPTTAEVVNVSRMPQAAASLIPESRVLVRVVGLLNAPVLDARVLIQNTESKRVWQAWTNSVGELGVELPRGPYSIEVEAPNYGRAGIRGVVIDASQSIELTVLILRAPKYRAPDA